MRVITKRLVTAAIAIFLFLSFNATAEETFKTTPVARKDGKWRIAYYEGGPYADYGHSLLETVKSLMAMGWIEHAALPDFNGDRTKAIWDWLSVNAKSEYLSFARDARYSAGWEDTARKKAARAILLRLSVKKDIDLVLAMGTWAGQDLANNRHNRPVMVLSTSDPLASGIVKGEEFSGIAHVHARVDPFRYQRQVRIFHDIIGFQKLGIIYEDSVTGKSYAAVDKVESVAAERGFEIIRCFARSDTPTKREAERNVENCFKELVQKVDALYVTKHGGVQLRNINRLATTANTALVPTFSQSGADEVRYGFLLSISKIGFSAVGRFYAETMAKILNGASPGKLSQIFESPSKIAINLKASGDIGFDPPVDVLGAADEIFRKIEFPE